MSDYQEAIQNPNICFSDPELKQGMIEKDRLGLPKPITGGFASVYQVKTRNRKYAVRCFLNNFPDQEYRYSTISKYLSQFNFPFMVAFSFIRNGILVKGQWYPILKMEWIEGITLNLYVKNNLQRSQKLRALADKILWVLTTLHSNRIAHGDLQHGNILILNDDIRLIDYDGMYVPGLESYLSHELGHRNYQHPRRSKNHFGPYLDHFSGLIIYLSLLALSFDPDLWRRLGNDEDSILFKKEDFDKPLSSKTIKEIRRINDPTILALVAKLEEFSRYTNINQLPALEDILKETSKRGPSRGIPEKPKEAIPLFSPQSKGDASWVWDHIQIPTKEISCKFIIERLAVLFFIILQYYNFIIWKTGLATQGVFYLLAIGLTALVLVFLDIRYRLLPECRQKNKTIACLRAAEVKIKQIEAALNKVQEEIKSLESCEAKEVTELIKVRDEIFRKEQLDLQKIESDLQALLKEINTQRQRLLDEEEKEVADALAEQKRKALEAYLRKHSIDTAVIDGVGPTLKNRILNSGIRSAADFFDIKIVNTSWGRYSNNTAYILVPGNRSIKVEGIGPHKARALLAWRRKLEAKYSNQIPNSLAPIIRERIRNKYKNKLDNLNKQETLAKDATWLNRHSIEIYSQSKRNDIEQKIHNVKKNYNKKKLELENIYLNMQKDLQQKKTELSWLKKDLNSYRLITFSNFIKSIFRNKY